MKANEERTTAAAEEADTNVLRFTPRQRVGSAEDAPLRFWPWPGAWPQGAWPKDTTPTGDDDDPGPTAA